MVGDWMLAKTKPDSPKVGVTSIVGQIVEDQIKSRDPKPKFANAGCAIVSNSSAYRMAPNVPLVIPEINADHLHLI